MPHDQLAELLAELQDSRELVRISAEVDTDLEIAALTHRACRLPGGGPVLFFERVRGASVPVVTNLFGSYARMSRYLGGESFDAVADRMSGLIQPRVAEGWFEQVKLIPQFTQLGKLPPRLVRVAACQQVVRLGRDIDLEAWPIPRLWPDDEARLLTTGIVCLRHPHTQEPVVEQVPLEVRDAQSFRVHLTPQSAGWVVVREHQRLRTPLSVAVAVGGDPLLTYVAGAPRPPGADAWLFAGFLRGAAVDLVTARTSDLELPAHAEVVFEGYIEPTEPWEPASRVGLPTGYYGEPYPVPTLHLTAITSRTNPVLPIIVPDQPPQERYWLHKLTERLFLPVLRMVVPELVDYSFPHAAAQRHLAFVSIRKSYAGQARKVLSALWGHPLTMHCKLLVVVDDEVDVQNPEAVWLAVGASMQPPRDLQVQDGPADWFDHSAPARGFGGKLGIDATRKLPEEHTGKAWPDQLAWPAEFEQTLDELWVKSPLAGWRAP